MPVAFTLVFMLFVIAAAFFQRIPGIVEAVTPGLSAVTFFVYAWDKSAARLGHWRTQESTLLLMGLAGGWPGALAAQRLLRHKSSKAEYLRAFWATVLLNAAGLAYLVWGGRDGIFEGVNKRALIQGRNELTRMVCAPP